MQNSHQSRLVRRISRALGGLLDFTLSYHWLLKVFPFHLIDRCDYFGFGFTTLTRKAL